MSTWKEIKEAAKKSAGGKKLDDFEQFVWLVSEHWLEIEKVVDLAYSLMSEDDAVEAVAHYHVLFGLQRALNDLEGSGND